MQIYKCYLLLSSSRAPRSLDLLFSFSQNLQFLGTAIWAQDTTPRPGGCPRYCCWAGWTSPRPPVSDWISAGRVPRRLALGGSALQALCTLRIDTSSFPIRPPQRGGRRPWNTLQCHYPSALSDPWCLDLAVASLEIRFFCTMCSWIRLIVCHQVGLLSTFSLQTHAVEELLFCQKKKKKKKNKKKNDPPPQKKTKTKQNNNNNNNNNKAKKKTSCNAERSIQSLSHFNDISETFCCIVLLIISTECMLRPTAL